MTLFGFAVADESIDKPKFVVGLGNPGMQYARTRHNIGFGVVEKLRQRWHVPPQGKQAFSGELYDARVTRQADSARVMMLEPQTFMNCSGRAVRQMMDFYKASPSDILVVLDDMALPLGQLRFRPEGSAGGHNGLADILAALGGPAVQRLRIGIGSPPGRMEWKDFVLTTFRSDEVDTIAVAMQIAAEAVEDWVFHGIRYVMDKYNRKSDD